MAFCLTEYILPFTNWDLSGISDVKFNKFLFRWWKDSGSSQLNFTRHRHVEYYTMASCISMEPKHLAFRMEFVKVCHLVTVLDDIYDTFGTMNELQLFTDAIKRCYSLVIVPINLEECMSIYIIDLSRC